MKHPSRSTQQRRSQFYPLLIIRFLLLLLLLLHRHVALPSLSLSLSHRSLGNTTTHAPINNATEPSSLPPTDSLKTKNNVHTHTHTNSLPLAASEVSASPPPLAAPPPPPPSSARASAGVARRVTSPPPPPRAPPPEEATPWTRSRRSA